MNINATYKISERETTTEILRLPTHGFRDRDYNSDFQIQRFNILPADPTSLYHSINNTQVEHVNELMIITMSYL